MIEHCFADYTETRIAEIVAAGGEFGEEWGAVNYADYFHPDGHDPNAHRTCMLPANHEGPHEWTPDSQIVVTFATGGGGDELLHVG